MTGENAAEEPSARPPGSKGDPLAWGTAIITCAALLAAVRYCPSYEAVKISLIQAWTGTFWKDLKDQISGIFYAKPQGTMAAEIVGSEWTYCGLVPFIVAWLVWRLWPELTTTPTRPSKAGYAVFGVGLFLYLIGFLMENYYVGMGSMEFIYAGLILIFLGWNHLRMLLFPVVFLMFMWPYNFMEDVAAEMRRHMSSLSHHVLEIIGVPNVLMGTAILSPHDAASPFAIDIADPCSGIRSLFALVMIAAVFAFVTFEKLWQQAVIVILAFPMVFLGNLVRIVILTLGTIHYGTPFALGTNDSPSWFHEGAGYLVYIINFGGLILAGMFLSKLTQPRPPDA